MTIAFSDVFSNALLQGDHEVVLVDFNSESESESESELENEVKKDSKLHVKDGFLGYIEYANTKKCISHYSFDGLLSPHLEIFSPPPES
jgi:hypothetical protein